MWLIDSSNGRATAWSGVDSGFDECQYTLNRDLQLILVADIFIKLANVSI